MTEPPTAAEDDALVAQLAASAEWLRDGNVSDMSERIAAELDEAAARIAAMQARLDATTQGSLGVVLKLITQERDDAQARIAELERRLGVMSHKWLDPNCSQNGCQSLNAEAALVTADERSDAWKAKAGKLGRELEKAELAELQRHARPCDIDAAIRAGEKP